MTRQLSKSLFLASKDKLSFGGNVYSKAFIIDNLLKLIKLTKQKT